MARSFDWIAPYYDSIARLVFGRTIHRCQLEYIDTIPAGARVLILGGGTGWILQELMKVNATCRVWYVEASIKMLEKAKRRSLALSAAEIFFIHGTEKDLQKIDPGRFDAVITSFYFDLFPSASLPAVLENIKASIKTDSKLLVSEFVEKTWWQRLMLSVMYWFFRLTCSVEASHLPDWQHQLRNGFLEENTTSFYHGFIKSSLYIFKGSRISGS